MSDRCSATWFEDWNDRQCSRAGTLEHKGRMYCKQHHPPSAEARRAAKPHCQHVESWGACDVTVPAGQKYCRFHATVDVGRDELAELRADKARLDWILADCIDRKVYVRDYNEDTHQYVYMCKSHRANTARDAIDAAMGTKASA